MKTLFDPIAVGSLSLKNRIIRSATFERPADASGRFVDFLLPVYVELARGGVGAVISGMMGVGPGSRLIPSMADAGDDAAIPQLRTLAERLREHDCAFLVQLSHCGRRATVTENDGPALGPMDDTQRSGKPVRAMTADDIRRLALRFGEAAARCREAGADGVQLHAGHGYGLSQFLSPCLNGRTDEYGGTIANRSRIVFAAYDAVRLAVGPDYPVWIKYNSADLAEGGITPEEFLWLGTALAERGMDALEVSGGIGESAASSAARYVEEEKDEGCFAPEALALAEKVAAPVISVCGYRTPSAINGWLNKGNITAISLCRPLLAEPDLVRRWQNGDLTKSRCISCNKCFVPRRGFGCQLFHAVRSA